MNIFGHLIKETEIIGIGPPHAHVTEFNGPYQNDDKKETKFCFRILTRCNQVLIDSPIFLKKDADKINAWTTEYIRIQNLVAVQIGELPGDTVRAHIDNVEDAYQKAQVDVNRLLQDLVPADQHAGPVNPKIETVFQSLQQLRNLACIYTLK